MTTEQATPRTDQENTREAIAFHNFPAEDQDDKAWGEYARVAWNFARALECELLTSQSTVEQLQGRVARLEEALKEFQFVMGYRYRDDSEKWAALFESNKKVNAALADSPNWLQGRLREERAKERERCAQVCDSQRHNTGKEWANWQAANCSALIRALPEE